MNKIEKIIYFRKKIDLIWRLKELWTKIRKQNKP